jgi:crotonobetainyl-CoA:carnitine CoA-transferase CaiB-like acyl-CoA transferase
MLERVVPPVERFLHSHTKQELFEGAVARRILMFPVATPHDIVNDTQLAARNYFQTVTLPDHGQDVTFLGPIIRSSEQPMGIRLLPPKVGQHNHEIFVDELGLAPQALSQLRRLGVI